MYLERAAALSFVLRRRRVSFDQPKQGGNGARVARHGSMPDVFSRSLPASFDAKRDGSAASGAGGKPSSLVRRGSDGALGAGEG